MVSAPSILIAIFSFLIAGTIVGFPLSRHLEALPQRRLLVAPALGLAVYAGACGLAFRFLPFTPICVISVFVVVAMFSFMAGGADDYKTTVFPGGVVPPLGAILAAIAVAALPAFAVMPHITGNSVSFGDPIFDHEKVAIIDEIVNNGNPPHNPFVSFAGSGDALNYYYLWYLLAATLSITTRLSGWTVDAALTFTTALASIMTVMWVATGTSGKKAAAWWVVATCLIGPIDSLLDNFLLAPWLAQFRTHEHTLEPWIIQASWVPQHVFAATIAVMAVLLIAKLFSRSLDPALCVLIGVLSAAIYASSVWVAVGFVLIVVVLALVCLSDIVESGALGRVLLNMTIVAVTAIVVASPFLAQQVSILGKAHTVEFWIFPVLRYPFFNSAAYWLLLLPLDFGFIYLAWILSKVGGLKDEPPVPVYVERALTMIAFVPLVLAQFFHSVIATNDLGWRSIIPSVLVMMAMASAFAVRTADNKPWVHFARNALIVLTLVPGILAGLWFVKTNDLNFILYPKQTDAGRDFLKEAALWQAVRNVTPVDEAVANNPSDLSALTPWPGDIGWALLSHRRHCAIRGPYLLAFRPAFSLAIRSEAGILFGRVFSGQGSDDDLRTMRDQFECRTLIVTPRDGLWASDLIEKSSIYKTVSQTAEWKILRAN
ncbi:MAG: hypothetical protein AB1508_10750 [Pseudomonadota bacterium]